MMLWNTKRNKGISTINEIPLTKGNCTSKVVFLNRKLRKEFFLHDYSRVTCKVCNSTMQLNSAVSVP